MLPLSENTMILEERSEIFRTNLVPAETVLEHT